MTITRNDVWNYLFKTFGPRVLGFSDTAQSVGATSITSTKLGSTQKGINLYAGDTAYRYRLTGDDQQKPLGVLSANTVTIADPVSYVNLTDLEWRLVKRGIDPDQVNEMISRAMDMVWAPTRGCYTDLPDGDFESAGVGNWLASSTDITRSKTQTQTYNRTGLNALYTANSTAGLYCYNATGVRVNPGDARWAGALVTVVQGANVRLVVWDDSNNREIGRVDAAGGGQLHLGLEYQVPAGCYVVNERLVNVDANMIVVWECLPAHNRGMHELRNLPSWIKSNRNLLGVDEAYYGREITQRVQSADTRRWVPWRWPGDYHTESTPEDAYPGAIIFDKYDTSHQPLPARDIFIYGQRPQSDWSDLSDEVSTTNADPNTVYAAATVLVADLVWARDGGSKWLDRIIADHQAIVDANRVERAVVLADPIQEHASVVM